MHQAAERQGVRSAALGWVGHHSETRGPQASVVPPGEASYADFPDDAGRTAQVIEQLDRPPAERPRLILAYLKGPDGVGHFKGTKAPETAAAVEAADREVGLVLDAIDAQPDADEIDLIVTTDHGMLPVTRVVNIARILHRHDIPARPVSTGTTSFLYFDREKEAASGSTAASRDADEALEEAVESAVEKLASYDEFDVVRPESPPPGWHIGSGPRVSELVVSAHPPFFIEGIDRFPWYLRWLEYVGPDTIDSSRALKASHGYPTGTPGVEGILYARGAAFAKGREVARVRAIDIHSTVMHILEIEPGQPVDGVVAQELLRAEP
jgi:arylsulfatase A-like enzyme